MRQIELLSAQFNETMGEGSEGMEEKKALVLK